MTNDWKKRLGVVYSSDPDFEYDREKVDQDETLIPKKQNLRVSLDKKQRKGKTVTLISGFIGREEDLKDLGRLLKSKCGVGGTVKNGEILVQGDFCEKILNILKKEGYMAKKSGG